MFTATVAALGCLIGSVVATQPTVAHAVPAAGNAADPVVVGPVTGGRGHPQFVAPFVLDEYGYSVTEYLVSGTARAYRTAAPPAPYSTRIMVYRPTDPARFSGNVVQEWGNVTGQIDASVELVWSYRQIFESGDAFVHVTAQQAGVCGMGLSGTPDVAGGVCVPTSLRGTDPARYGTLTHPGDIYADDIFSQVAQVVRRPVATAPLGGLTARQIIAVGESQSAIALDNYILSGADAATRVFDGFVIDADGHTEKPRAYRVPTVTVWSEESARPEHVLAPNHATWSVAGAAHTDHWFIAEVTNWAAHSLLGAPAHGRAEQEVAEVGNGDYGTQGPGASLTCAGNNQFPRRYVVDAAIAAVQTWASTGVPAPQPPPLRFTGGSVVPEPGPAVRDGLGVLMNAISPELGGIDVVELLGVPWALARDGDDNAIGGLRLPPMTVPVAAYDGSLCVAAGTTTPFSPQRLRELYPTHADYVARVIDAVRDSVDQRFLTRRDGVEMISRACASAIPNNGTTPPEQQPGECSQVEAALGA
ncbi:alpha/beta hydrolase domain-containing protein [Nocardia bovistercoris]|uniref:Alpha/beta hydrolase domain-containing protein n=1 Tax=Nocardia bovistercoris TaxID=2785916 RepID=A0A931IF90_9NOCA|nr:hypothetical protein [Nocardia bovistercoris]